jgi:hypothetical protein
MQLTHLNQIEAEGLSHDADITKKVLFSETDMPASVRLSHPIGEGSAIRVDAGEVHSLKNTGDDALSVIYFGLKT